jgi:hypothetical protein
MTWENNQVSREMFKRALDVANDGSTLLQSFVNRTVQQLTLREFGLQAVLERKEGTGQAEIINRRAPGADGGKWVDDAAGAVVDETGTYTQESFTFRTLATRGKVSRKLQATGKSYADVLSLEMSAKAEDFANQLEFGLIQGDTAGKVSGGSANANICNGFITLIQNVGTLDQVVSNAGATTANASVVLSKLDQAIDLVKGSAQRGDLVIVGSFAGIRSVNDALQGQQRFNDVTEIAAGFRVRTYDGIPLVVSTEVPNNFVFSTAGRITNTNSDGTCLLVLNTRYCYISELTPTTVMPLAKTDSQFDSFDMYWDGAPVLSNTKGASMLTHVLA